ncbi:MAG: restriction endonuclease subunit S [bacterium]|nr:restriction endonuclease subunit S [bacterium]
MREGLSKTRYVKKGDFLLSNSMSFGRPYILNIDGCIHDGWLVLSSVEKCFDKDFLYYLLSSYYIFTQFCGSVSGAVVKNLNSDKVANAVVCIPPLEEQKRIVEKLEEILPLVEEYGKNEEKLSKLNETLPKKIRQSILQHAVQGKLVPQNPNDEPASELLKRIKAEKEQLIKDSKIKKEKPLPPITKEEIPYELPQGWEWVKLGDIVNYGSTGTVDNTDNMSKDTWILDLEDIEKESSKLLKRNRLKDKDFNSSKKLFNVGDVLYGKLRPYLDKVLVADENGICTTEILPLRAYGNIYPYYLRIYLKNPIFIQYVNQLTYGVKMPRLGTDDGKNALVSLPPVEEQKRIVVKVDELLQLVDKLEM